MKKRAKRPSKADERNFLLSMLEYALLHAKPESPDFPTKSEIFEFLFPEPLDSETRKLERKLNRLHDQLLRIPLSKTTRSKAR